MCEWEIVLLNGIGVITIEVSKTGDMNKESICSTPRPSYFNITNMPCFDGPTMVVALWCKLVENLKFDNF